MTAETNAAALAEMTARKDAAYLERNQVVAALAKCFPSGVARTAIEGWSEDWHGCVYIDLPTGQVSWHFHDSQAHLFSDLPPYVGTWDGHDTPEKYRRLALLRAGAAKVQEKRCGYCDGSGDVVDQIGEWRGVCTQCDAELRNAAQAVVERWDTPLWKDEKPTADYIARLRRALATPPAPDAGVVEHSRPPLPFLPATLTVEQIRGAVQAVVDEQKGTQ